MVISLTAEMGWVLNTDNKYAILIHAENQSTIFALNELCIMMNVYITKIMRGERLVCWNKNDVF